ncbi:MAG: type II toxin-antitoxin system RelE/ParE family toxin [Chloroflexi bacterium]|nr:type II toxin-antitoxin system RelE/ParE family toxin [Chloroflexota bacterium]
MIKSFKCEETERIYKRQKSSKFPESIQKSAHRKLLIIDAATDFRDLQIPPGNHLEILQDDREGQLSIKVNDQYRICFVWNKGDAYQVELIDYH